MMTKLEPVVTPFDGWRVPDLIGRSTTDVMMRGNWVLGT
jgi:hypothetical protein